MPGHEEAYSGLDVKLFAATVPTQCKRWIYGETTPKLQAGGQLFVDSTLWMFSVGVDLGDSVFECKEGASEPQ